MSIFDYVESRDITKTDPGFYALLFSLMRKADTINIGKLQAAWPIEWEELQARYNAPGGCLNGVEREWYDRYLEQKEDD